jgi:hypothetical protein
LTEKKQEAYSNSIFFLNLNISQQVKENSNDYKCISDFTDDDIRGMEFSTEGEAITFYTLYAHLHGFVIRKDEVKHDREKNIVMRQLLCNKEGTSDGELVVVRNFE